MVPHRNVLAVTGFQGVRDLPHRLRFAGSMIMRQLVLLRNFMSSFSILTGSSPPCKYSHTARSILHVSSREHTSGGT